MGSVDGLASTVRCPAIVGEGTCTREPSLIAALPGGPAASRPFAPPGSVPGRFRNASQPAVDRPGYLDAYGVG